MAGCSSAAKIASKFFKKKLVAWHSVIVTIHYEQGNGAAVPASMLTVDL